MLGIRLEIRSRTAQSNRTQCTFEKTITDCNLAALECSHRKKVGIGRRRRKYDFDIPEFFHKEVWFRNHRFELQVEAFLFKCCYKYACSSGFGNSHKHTVVRLCVRLNLFGIIGLFVKDQSKKLAMRPLHIHMPPMLWANVRPSWMMLTMHYKKQGQKNLQFVWGISVPTLEQTMKHVKAWLADIETRH